MIGAPLGIVQDRCQLPVTSAKTWGQRIRSTHMPALWLLPILCLSPFPRFLPSCSPPPSAWLDSSLACLTSGHCLSCPCIPSLAPFSCLWEPAAPAPHPSCHSLKLHPWVTRHGAEPLPSEDENCTLVEVTEEEVENSVKHIPSLATVVRRDGPLTKSRDRESPRQAQRGWARTQAGV